MGIVITMYRSSWYLQAGKLALALAIGLGLASLTLAPWGLGWVLGLGLLGGGLAWVGYRLLGRGQIMDAVPAYPPLGPWLGSGAAPRVRARATLRKSPPARLSESEAAQMLAELRLAKTAAPCETLRLDPKLLRRYRRLQKSGMQPLFELEALNEVA
ncbi:MAG: hypothetical protein KatS3mg072_1228 [Meiothermus sp.]|nr:MAG: hypothetical protein KatS3mg072_1228 [Meiothermus sp.]